MSRKIDAYVVQFLLFRKKGSASVNLSRNKSDHMFLTMLVVRSYLSASLNHQRVWMQYVPYSQPKVIDPRMEGLTSGMEERGSS
mmetsp:Transcript_23360/g.38057  ORF Transcript_23360/g.38057 Transcript_23360/m.38057 type:complete len:84 (+) Transcript_23360:395-646(+)